MKGNRAQSTQMARATRSSASHAVLEKASGPAGRAPAAPKKDVKQVVKEESEDDEEVVTNSTEEESILDTGSEDDDEEDNTDDDEEEEDEFEDQGSSTDEDESIMSEEGAVDSDASEGDETEGAAITNKAESSARSYQMQRYADLARDQKSGVLDVQRNMHLDDLSSDDEEAEGNTIGRVPLHWYDAYDHIGYDVSGNKMVKRVGKDRIDEALEANASSKDAAHRTVFDMYNSREVVLSERDLEIIRRIQAGAFAHAEFNDTPDYIDYYTHEQEKMPISAAPEPKRRFVPSKWEMMRVMKIVKAIKEGRYVDSETAAKQRKEQEDNTLKGLFMVWNDQEDETLADSKRNAYHMPAPKIPLPGHAESYNPPSEYLLSEQEQKEMEELDPSERPYNFIPKQHKCLRHVGAYPNLVKERFERCLDLYLCPRQLKKRLNIDPESLIPRLPRPKELKPFPNSLCLQYIGHKKAVRCIAVSPDGQFLVSGSEDGTVMLWEVDCGLCRYVWDFKGVPVTALAWNPNPSHHVIAASVGKSVVFITTGTGDKDSTELTDSLLAAVETKAVAAPEDAKANEEDGNLSDDSNAMSKKNVLFPWRLCSSETMTIRSGKKVGPRVRIDFPGPVTHIAWHHRGDYFGVLCPNSGSQTLSIHQMSKASSQTPFRKSPGMVQTFAFHPSMPFFFVVTQQHVKVFHLVEQKLMKKLLSGSKWLSSVDVHGTGDHVLLGSYDRRLIWFDLDLASTPYKVLKFHEKAIRCVQFHRRFPLMASASDDGTVHVFHATVYNDLSRNPMIVPLRILRGHGVVGGIGVHAIAFHPRQPWIFSAGADGLINLYQDI